MDRRGVRKVNGGGLMHKAVKIALLIVAGILIVAQFFQPDRNLQEQATENDIMLSMEVPAQVAALLKNACYDCHSNQTRYPWYSKISPVSWYLHKHVVEGKEALNFSEFGQLGKRKMIGSFSSICEVLEAGNMPLASYTLIHRDANLEQEERDAICDWAESETGQLMNSGSQATDP